MLEAARKHNPEAPFVFASTNKVYGKLQRNNRACKETQAIDFHSPYGCSKGAADQYVRDYARCFQMNTVVLRQSCIYGAHQYGTEDQGWVAHFVHSILRTGPHDLRAALGTATCARRSRFGRLRRVIDNIEKTGARSTTWASRRTSATCSGHRAHRRVGEQTPRFSFANWREGDRGYYVSDITKAKEQLGWEPRSDLTRAFGTSSRGRRRRQDGPLRSNTGEVPAAARQQRSNLPSPRKRRHRHGTHSHRGSDHAPRPTAMSSTEPLTARQSSHEKPGRQDREQDVWLQRRRTTGRSRWRSWTRAPPRTLM
jgi:hypothetical protein